MVNQPIIIATIATTKHIIAALYYNSDPLAEVKRVVKNPGDDTSNYIFVDVNPGAATIRYYESDDGTDLTTFLGDFQLNISEKKAVFEERFYKVGGLQMDDDGIVVDPVPEERTLTDSYFDGKTVTSMTRRGYGPLQQEIEWSRSDNTISLLNPETLLPDGPVFVAGDVWVVMLTYLQEIVMQAPQTRIFYDEITTDTTLTSDYRNKWVSINGAGARITITAEDIATIPDGDWYGFLTNGGSQHQVIFKAESGQSINVNGQDKSFVVFGKMERWQIFKRGTKFEILQGLDYLHDICRFFKSHKRSEINGLWCDGAQYSGDDYPRPFYEIKNMQDSINSPTVNPDRIGSFYWWETGSGESLQRWFRTPNKQDLFSRNLKYFDGLGTDGSRLSDYPGGRQVPMVGPHFHYTVVNTELTTANHPEEIDRDMKANNSIIKKYNKTSGQGKESVTLAGSASTPTLGKTSSTLIEGFMITPGTETRPENVGEFEFVRI